MNRADVMRRFIARVGLISVSVMGLVAASPAPHDWVTVTVAGSASEKTCVRIYVDSDVAGRSHSEPHYVASAVRIGDFMSDVMAHHMTSSSSVVVRSGATTTTFDLSPSTDVSGRLSVEFYVECAAKGESVTAIVFVTGAGFGNMRTSVESPGGRPIPTNRVVTRSGSGSRALALEEATGEGASVVVGGAGVGIHDFTLRATQHSLLVLLSADCGAGCLYDWTRPDGTSGSSRFDRGRSIADFGPAGIWNIRVSGAKTFDGYPWGGRGNGAVALIAPLGDIW